MGSHRAGTEKTDMGLRWDRLGLVLREVFTALAVPDADLPSNRCPSPWHPALGTSQAKPLPPHPPYSAAWRMAQGGAQHESSSKTGGAASQGVPPGVYTQQRSRQPGCYCISMSPWHSRLLRSAHMPGHLDNSAACSASEALGGAGR